MRDADVAARYLEAISRRDFDTVAEILSPEAEIVDPEGTSSGADFLRGLRAWEGLENLDISIEDRALTEEDGAIVSRARRVFRWKESGEIAYEQAAEVRMTVREGTIIRVEMR